MTSLLLQELQSIHATNQSIMGRLSVLERTPAYNDQPAARGPTVARVDPPHVDPAPPRVADVPQTSVPDHLALPRPLRDPRLNPQPAQPQVQATTFMNQLHQEEARVFQPTGEGEIRAKAKSGQFRVGGEVPVLKHVWWPHDLCFVGAECRRVHYDDLSPLVLWVPKIH